MWLVASLAGYGLLAVAAVLDKFIIARERVHPVTFVFYTAILVLPIWALAPFIGGGISDFYDIIGAAVAGIFFAIGLYAMYRSLQTGEASHIGPLIGGVMAFVTVILTIIILNEQLAEQQMLAVGLLIAGSLMISLEYNRGWRGWNQGVAWAVLASILFAVSHVASKYIYLRYGFGVGLVWTRGFLGLCAVPLLLSRSVRQQVFGGRYSGQAKSARSRSKLLVVINKLSAVAGTLGVQYAIALGSVTVVNALDGFQYALLVGMIGLLTIFKPRWFKENYSRGEVAQEIAAVVLIGIGLALLV